MKRREFLTNATSAVAACAATLTGTEMLANIAPITEHKSLPAKERRILDLSCFLPETCCHKREFWKKYACFRASTNDEDQSMLEICTESKEIPDLCVPIVRVLSGRGYIDSCRLTVELDSEQTADRIFKYFMEHVCRMGDFGKYVQLMYYCGINVRSAMYNSVYGQWQEHTWTSDGPITRSLYRKVEFN